MRRLIVCCDGTWNSPDQEKNHIPSPTNVVRFAYHIAKDDGDTPQLVYYHQGVGTGNWVDQISGGAFGRGLVENVEEAYRFLIANYRRGDEIYLIGFSRGAFTARSVGGLIRKCGVLARSSLERYREARELYHDECAPDSDQARRFRAEHAIGGDVPVPIQMVGVWDTVGSLGIPVRGLRNLTAHKYQFHDTKLSGSVKFAFHALAIDERRAPFAPALWSNAPKPGQRVEQVWFCGAHSDVGGGYRTTGLSDVALRWMLDKAELAGLKLLAPHEVAHVPTPRPDASLHNSKRGLYRLTWGRDRPIGLIRRADTGAIEVDATQSLHSSVLARWDSDRSYRPKNLREYLDREDKRRETGREGVRAAPN